MGRWIGLVDAGFLKAEGSGVLGLDRGRTRFDASAVVAWLDELAGNEGVLRTYWYDGAFDPADPRAAGQRRFHDAIAFTPGIKLRLGHIVSRPPKFKNPIRRAIQGAAQELGVDEDELLAAFDERWEFRHHDEQKGIDTLMALDLVRLAQRHAYDTAVVLSGDRDLSEAVQAAQDQGRRVIIASPATEPVADELRQHADAFHLLEQDVLERMLRER